MSRDIAFFLDFMSPFAYLAHQRLPGLAQQYGYRVIYKPINLPLAKKAAGNSGPPNVQIAPKLRYLICDLGRWAQRYQVPLSFPKSLDSDQMNKGLFYALDMGAAEQYARTAWHQYWGLGGDPADEQLLRRLAGGMGWSANSFISYVRSDDAARRYDQTNAEAHQLGVFGVPTMLIGQEMWWGNDRLEFMEAFLQADALKNARRRNTAGE